MKNFYQIGDSIWNFLWIIDYLSIFDILSKISIAPCQTFWYFFKQGKKMKGKNLQTHQKVYSSWEIVKTTTKILLLKVCRQMLTNLCS